MGFSVISAVKDYGIKSQEASSSKLLKIFIKTTPLLSQIVYIENKVAK